MNKGITFWVSSAVALLALLQGAVAQSVGNHPFFSKEESRFAVESIVKPDGNVPFAERLRAAHALGTNLTAAEVASVYDYLLMPNSATAPDPRSERWLRNDLMNKLVTGQNSLPPGLTDLLLGIYQDPRQDVVMRDYAIQQLPMVHQYVSEREQKSITEALWRATKETNSSIAGTALLSLTALCRDAALSSGSAASTVERVRIAKSALAVAQNPRCGELARITAVSLCGRMRLNEAMPIISELAEKAESIPLRIAAVAALGDLGTSDARAVLQRVANEQDARLRPGIESALARVQNSNEAGVMVPEEF